MSAKETVQDVGYVECQIQAGRKIQLPGECTNIRQKMKYKHLITHRNRKRCFPENKQRNKIKENFITNKQCWTVM